LLSDPDLAVIKRWGIINQDRPTVPHPAAVVVDSEGEIRYLRVDVDYTKRPSAAELLEAID
jgi:peroxiredoxin